jgi:hypothetical protein
VLGVLLALALGAALALWLILAAYPVGARAEDGAAGVPATPATPVAVETVGPAVVITSNSCIADDPRDVVAVEGPGGRRLMPLDGCGTPVGSKLTVRMAFVGTEPAADTPARVLGTGSAAALAATEPAESPLTGRLAILLTGVAGLGMAGLLVAVVRERSRRPAARTAAPPARPTRTTTTTAAPRPPVDRAADRATVHRPASRPGRSAKAGRPAALDAGRRVPAPRGGTSRRITASSEGRPRSRGTDRGTGGGSRRPAAGPHRR